MIMVMMTTPREEEGYENDAEPISWVGKLILCWFPRGGPPPGGGNDNPAQRNALYFVLVVCERKGQMSEWLNPIWPRLFEHIQEPGGGGGGAHCASHP